MILINRKKQGSQDESIDSMAALDSSKPLSSSSNSSRFTFGTLFRKKPISSQPTGTPPKEQKHLKDKDHLKDPKPIKSPHISGPPPPKLTLHTDSESFSPELHEGSSNDLEMKNADYNHTGIGGGGGGTNISTKSYNSTLPSLILGDDHGNFITIVDLNEHTSTHHSDRNLSFTTDCISLQNSEMTSHFDDDHQSKDHDMSPIGMRLLNGHDTKLTLRSILKKKSSNSRQIEKFTGRLSHHDFDREDDGFDDHSMENADDEDIRDIEDNFSSSGRSITYDETEYLSESDSDLNYDPLQEENEDDYKQGGYHPVQQGEVYFSQNDPNVQYVTLRKLGWGHFSTVWLAKAVFKNNLKSAVAGSASTASSILELENYVAIKFVKLSKNYLEAAEDEIKLLQTVNQPLIYGEHLTQSQKNFFKNFHINQDNEPVGHPGFKHVMKLLDNFEISGPNGRHICMVFEILGENVLNTMSKYKMIYSNLSKEFELKRKSKKKSKQETPVHGVSKKSNSTNPVSEISSTAAQPIRKISNSFTFENLHFSKKESKKKSTVSKLSLGLVSGDKKSSPPPDPATLEISNAKEAILTGLDDVLTAFPNSSKTLHEKIKSLDDTEMRILLENLKTYGGLPLVIVKQIFKQIFLALDYIHHCGVIHTDIKPENILIEIKDIHKVIKMMEHEKIARHNSRKLSDPPSSSLKGSINNPKRNNSSYNPGRKNSLHSSTSSFKRSGYCQSRSCSTTAMESPVRSSKPLFSPITSDIIFKSVSYQDNSSSQTQFPNRSFTEAANHSPTTRNSVKSNKSLNGNVQQELAISIKIADLGNGTFANHHFTNQIQTRQYRSPEILLGYRDWGASTDIWSLGCMLFELITGDYLFDPHDGKSYDRDDDHLAQIIELVGKFPSSEYLSRCRHSDTFFKSLGGEIKFRKIPHLKFWPLSDVLVEKYHFDKDDANVFLISDLISKCLLFDPKDRYDAGLLSNHPWFDNCGDNDHLDRSPNTKGDDVPGFYSTYSINENIEFDEGMDLVI